MPSEYEGSMVLEAGWFVSPDPPDPLLTFLCMLLVMSSKPLSELTKGPLNWLPDPLDSHLWWINILVIWLCKESLCTHTWWVRLTFFLYSSYLSFYSRILTRFFTSSSKPWLGSSKFQTTDGHRWTRIQNKSEAHSCSSVSIRGFISSFVGALFGSQRFFWA